MKKALGLVETIGLSNTILVADTMVKTANVQIINIENTKGLGYMTIKILGDVGAVNAAVNSGRKIAIENNAFVSIKVIPRPSDYIEDTFCQLEKEKIKSTNKKKNIIKEKNVSKSRINIDDEKQISKNINIVENKEKVNIENKEVKIEDKKVSVENKEVKIEDKKVSVENKEVELKKEKINVEIEKKNKNKENLSIGDSNLEEKKSKKNNRKKKEFKKDNS